MFCRLTYSCIQFTQRQIPPLSMKTTKLNHFGLVLLYEKSRLLSTGLINEFSKKTKTVVSY